MFCVGGGGSFHSLWVWVFFILFFPFKGMGLISDGEGFSELLALRVQLDFIYVVRNIV